MVDVVGLRFVTEGEQAALRALELYRRGLIQTSNIQDRHVNTINRAIQREIAAFQNAQRIRERTTQQEVQRVGTQIQMMNRSAAEQERTVNREVAALQRNMAMKNRFTQSELAAVGQRVQMMNRSAAEQERTVNREVAALQRNMAMKNRFTQSELAAVGQRVQMMNRSAAEQERSVQREVRAFQHVEAVKRRFTQEELADTGRRIAMMNRSAAEQERALNREVTALRHNMRLRERSQRDAERAAQAQQRAQEREAAQTRRATTERERAAQALTRFSASFDPAIAAQQRMANAQRIVNEAVRTGAVTKQQGAAAMAAYRASLSSTEQAALRANNATSVLRTQFLATANTIAILDGPLGGIASRFSAFGVLLGRTGLLLGTAAVAFTALAAVTARGVRSFSQFEVETAKINAALETTRHAAGLTGQEIESMAARIALSTLESEQGIRQAATRLLTFRDVSGEVFEDVLKAATDMAALGFGTVESEATKLAKALEDPAQALTSLSRAGIVFTRQQRAMIISMVEAGDRAGAMERILANVNRRVGGAAEAAARDTFAGSMDTIGQAAGRAVREMGRFIVEISGLGRAAAAVAESVSDFAAGPADTVTQIQRLNAELKDLPPEADRAATALGRMAENYARAMGAGRGDTRRAQILRELEELQEVFAQEQRIARLRQQQGQVERRREGIDNLQAEIDLRTRLIGLTEDQQRTMRAFAAEGLLNPDIEKAIADYQKALTDAAEQPADIARAMVRRAEEELRSLTDLMDKYLLSLQEARTVAEAMRTAEGLDERKELQAEVLRLMQQGVEASEAQRIAQDAVTETQIRAAIAAAGTNTELVAQLETALENLRVLREQETAIDAITDAQRRLADIDDRVRTLQEENRIIEMQLQLMDEGMDYTKALALGEIEVEKARLRTLVVTGQITDELLTQAALLHNLEQETIRNFELLRDREGRRPSRSPSGGGAGRDPVDIADTIRKMEIQIDRERQLIGLTRAHRTELEILFRLQDANRDADIQMSQEALENTARRIAAEQEKNAVLEEQQQVMENIARTIENQMERAFMSIVDGTKSAKDAFRDMARAILSELFRVLVVQQLVGSFSAGGGGIAGAIFGAFNADGNAYSGGNVVPFANGGVVNRPTTFPMSGGRTGLMGEAGPEAILPLKRGKDGKLGVTVEGSGGTVVNQTFSFNLAANGDESVKRIVAQAAPQIVEAAKSGVLDARRRGGSYRAAFG